MATQAKSPSIAPILAVTILTSICVSQTEGVLASELSAATRLQRQEAREIRQRDDVPSSADTVAEARWARLPDDYVLGEGGQIVPRHQVSEPIGVPESEAVGLELDNNHFDSSVQPDTPECGPSPATPAEITRLVVEASQRHDVPARGVITTRERRQWVGGVMHF